MPEAKAKIGVIGGTGLYQVEGLTDIEEINIRTPLASPAIVFCWGRLKGCGWLFCHATAGHTP